MKDDIKRARKQISIIASYKEVFSSELGRKVLLDLMKDNHMGSSTFVEDKSDLSAFHQGERNVILKILHRMKTNTEQLLKNLEEAAKEATEY